MNPAGKIFFIACYVATCLIGAFPANAEDTYQAGISIVIGQVRTVTVDTQYADFQPTAPELIEGWTQVQTINAMVSANTHWEMTIRGSDEYWNAPWEKPVGDIFWSYDGSEYVPLTVDPAFVVNGSAVVDENYSIEFIVALDPLKDIPGDYSYPQIIVELSDQ
jgi:hypothetical protein